MTRFFYTLMQTWHYRHELSHISSTSSILDLDPEQLHQQGIKVLALDFDGVLAAHGQPTPRADVVAWLNHAVHIFSVENLFILSNKPDQVRADYFKQSFPGLRFISGVRKKPYPEGVEKILKLSQANPDQVMLLDDRLLTGVLAAQIAGIEVIHIRKPFTDVASHPVSERFFKLLRKIENWLF